MLSLTDLAGQVICTGIPGPRLDAETAILLERLHPSGIILFKRNIENVTQLRELTDTLHALPSSPLVGIDHEGGSVMRVGAPFTQFPSAYSVGRAGRPELACAVGAAMGVELASVGVDINFAPVLDVNSNPHNPVIGERAFGATPEFVTEFALATMAGLRAGGVIPCGKHFPGHGDTDRDSHCELPVVRRSRAELEAVELRPFRAAIAAGIPMLMTAHVVYSALDAHCPGTVSHRIVHELLRRELQFGGVIVSDDLQMQALSATRTVATSAVAALQAGVDWLLIGNALDQALDTAAHIVAEIESGTLARATVEAAASRIRALPHAHVPTPISLPAAEHEELNQKVRAAAASAATEIA